MHLFNKFAKLCYFKRLKCENSVKQNSNVYIILIIYIMYLDEKISSIFSKVESENSVVSSSFESSAFAFIKENFSN